MTVRLSVDRAADLGTVRADPGQLEQVLRGPAGHVQEDSPQKHVVANQLSG